MSQSLSSVPSRSASRVPSISQQTSSESRSDAVSSTVTSNSTVTSSSTASPLARLMALRKLASAVIVGATFSMVTFASETPEVSPSSSTDRTEMMCSPDVGQDVATSEAEPSVETVKLSRTSLRFQSMINPSLSLSVSSPCARRITVWSS